MAQPKRKEKDRPGEELSSPPAAVTSSIGWRNNAGLSTRGWAILIAVILIANLPVIHYWVFRGHATANVTLPYEDDFSSRERLHQNYWSSGGLWRLINGELYSPGVKNNPLWLQAKLPQNVAVEFDARSMSPEGDLKVEIFGDGVTHASGYILIHGGWNNSVSVIARLDEHGKPAEQLNQEARKIASEHQQPSANWVDTGVFHKDTRMRVEAKPYPVQIGKTYHWRIERRGSVLSWFIDGQPFMSFDDPFPLVGEDHNRFGFSSWDADLYFDNLKITPL